MKTMQAGEFKAKCLAVMDEVLATGEPVLVTKRGKPVVRLVAPESNKDQSSPESIFGSLRHMLAAPIADDFDKPMFTDEEWEKMFQEKWDRFDRASAE